MSRELTYAEAIREAIDLAMARDERVFLFGEDVGVYGGAFGVTEGLYQKYGPERVRDTPISEAVIAGVATGAALTGMRPIAEIQFMDFITLSMEQLVLQAAKLRFMLGGKVTVPFVLRTPAGAGTGAAAQHSESLENWFVHVPGLKVVMPSTPADAKGLLLGAIEDPNPVIFVEHKLLYRVKGEVPEGYYTLPLSRSQVKRSGRDVTIVATSLMVSRALEAAAQLAAEGIEVEVVDPCTLKPLDSDPIVRSVVKTGRVLIVHEACKTGGFGGELAAVIAESEAFDFLDAPIRRLAGLDIPVPYNRELERRMVPQVDDIATAARRLVREAH
ncbi:MAG: alpha-ketoacid dehydrogenase subunit beta [Chloroflexi bacterium]|jgi:pyruvate dehydrogenase E1 component beta subunit|nr:alpha-ketoacid dehydrogenase subunit beta [Chloroflexota bacterium]